MAASSIVVLEKSSACPRRYLNSEPYISVTLSRNKVSVPLSRVLVMEPNSMFSALLVNSKRVQFPEYHSEPSGKLLLTSFLDDPFKLSD